MIYRKSSQQKELEYRENLQGARTELRTTTFSASPEEEAAFHSLIPNLSDNFASLISSDANQIKAASEYFRHIFAFKIFDPKLTTLSVVSSLCNAYMISSDAQTQINLLHAIVNCIKVRSFSLPDDFIELVLSFFGSTFTPISQELIEWAELLFKVFSYLMQSSEKIIISSGFVSQMASLLCISASFDCTLTEIIQTAIELRRTNDCQLALYEFCRFGVSSPFVEFTILSLIKCLTECLHSEEEEESFLKSYPEILLQFTPFWGASDDVNSALLNIADDKIPIELLVEFLQHGGFEIIQESLFGKDNILISKAFSVISLFPIDKWPFMFSISDALALVVPNIWNGNIITKWQAGNFMGTIASQKPDIFYEKFYESYLEHFDDSDDDPDINNYARAFGYFLQLEEENECLCQIIEGLHSIGEYFISKNQMHEFRETLDLYSIGEFVENICEAKNQNLNRIANIFYFTFIHCIF